MIKFYFVTTECGEASSRSFKKDKEKRFEKAMPSLIVETPT